MVQEQAAVTLLILLANGLRSRAFFDVVKNYHSQRAFLGTLASCRLDLLIVLLPSHVTCTLFMLTNVMQYYVFIDSRLPNKQDMTKKL
jgi:hypothetical protein